MTDLLQLWYAAARTSAGLFWTAFWSFAFGYVISSAVQVFVTRERMRKSMGGAGFSSVGRGTFYGFLSSSCSFSALAATRTLFAKGADLVPSLAFLLGSTNLVVELGILIGIFLGWQFVVGEYVGGVLLILLMWFVVAWTRPVKIVENARTRARRYDGGAAGESETARDWKSRIASGEAWRQVGVQYAMEWGMVWKDVAIGFAVAGIIAVFVPTSAFEALFPGAGRPNPSFGQIAIQSVVGPFAAFLTFIGSMGNIPLAAVLFSNGVSFAGTMAFIFSDLVVFPVLRIQAHYYGWKMAGYILAVFLGVLVVVALVLHYGFQLLGILPGPESVATVSGRTFFSFDYTFFLNAAFLAVSGVLFLRRPKSSGPTGHQHGGKPGLLLVFALAALAWVAIGLALPLVTGS